MLTENQKLDPALRDAVLARTPKQIAEDAEDQEEARKRLEHLVTDSPAANHYKSAVRIEESLRNAGDAGRERLAENLFWQGRFAEAAVLTEVDFKRSEYNQFAGAMQLFGGPMCEHTTIQVAGGRTAKGVSVPAKREVQRVCVGGPDTEIKFIRCERCKTLFAQPV